MERKRYATLYGDAEQPVRRHAHRRPIVATVYVGTPDTDPSREMGGAGMCPSIALEVRPDGSWSVFERTTVAGVPATREVASGTVDGVDR